MMEKGTKSREPDTIPLKSVQSRVKNGKGSKI